VFFSANDGVRGAELWKSDGRAAGTVRVKDIVAGPDSSSPADLQRVGERVFFRADDGVHGAEVWMSDGTEAGPNLVRDVLHGAPSSSAREFSTKGSHLMFFSANGGKRGLGIWQTDGTEQGTRPVAVGFGPREDEMPASLTPLGQRLLFIAKDERHGTELWAIASCGDGVVDPSEQCDAGPADDAAGSCCGSDCNIVADCAEPETASPAGPDTSAVIVPPSATPGGAPLRPVIQHAPTSARRPGIPAAPNPPQRP
jgi:ELWxxDGT repeat protein